MLHFPPSVPDNRQDLREYPARFEYASRQLTQLGKHLASPDFDIGLIKDRIVWRKGFKIATKLQGNIRFSLAVVNEAQITCQCFRELIFGRAFIDTHNSIEYITGLSSERCRRWRPGDDAVVFHGQLQDMLLFNGCQYLWAVRRDDELGIRKCPL